MSSGTLSRRDFIGGAAAVGAGITLLGLAGCSSGASEETQGGDYASGTYTAQATGLDTVSVEMTFSGAEITDVQIDASHETANIGGAAALELQEAILLNQGLDVDAVSGATMTSTAVALAAKNCMDQAQGAADAIMANYIDPIPPAPMPDAWDFETEVLFVGANGGGVVSAARLAENGISSITIEKNSYVGGTANVTGNFHMYGGTKLNTLLGDGDKGCFGTPYKDQDVIDYWQERSEWTANPELLQNMTISLREVVDYWVDHDVAMGQWPDTIGCGSWWYGALDEKGENYATDVLISHMHQIAEDNGAEYLFYTKVTALVMDDDGRCVGVQAFREEDGQTIYVKGNQAVVLSADNFQTNPYMLEKYCGLGKNVKSGLARGNGEVIRMGQGVGADMAGLGTCPPGANSLTVLPSDGDLLPFCQYYDFIHFIVRNPWFCVDEHGERIDHLSYTKSLELAGEPFDILEVWTRCGTQQLMRGNSYKFFDANWEQYAETYTTLDTGTFNVDIGRSRINNPENPAYIPPEWGGTKSPEESFGDALANGALKQADSIEELAEQMGLDPQVLTSAIDNWNTICERGSDDTLYHYEPSWLNPIKEPPFYGVEVTVGLYSSWCGLKVSEKQEVINTDGDIIPGLYANFHVAGGLCGEGANLRGMGDQIGAMFASGYSISKALLGEEYVKI